MAGYSTAFVLLVFWAFSAGANCLNPADDQFLPSKDISFLLWNVEKNRGALSPYSRQYFSDESIMLFQEINQAGLDRLQSSLDMDYHESILNNRKYGVASLSAIEPCEEALVDVKDEPLFAKIDKAIVAKKFRLEVGAALHPAELLVINVHLPLFVVGGAPGHGAYKSGLREIEKLVSEHCGPVVIAGDFNGWTPNRMYSILPRFQERLGLDEIDFDRSEGSFVSSNLKLDRVYHRDLTVDSFRMQKVDSTISDHYILKFSFNYYKDLDCR